MGIILGLFAALAQALSFVCIKKSYENLSPAVTFFFNAFFGLLIFIPYALIIGFQFNNWPSVFFYAVIAAILAEAFVFYVMSQGELAITGTVFSSYPIFTIIFSILINHESLKIMQWLAIALTIIGIIVVSLPNKINKEELKKISYIGWALSAAIAVGISDTLSKGIIDETSSELFLFNLAFAQMIVALIYMRLIKEPISQFKKIIGSFKKYQFAIYGSFLMTVALVFLFSAFASTYASIASPLSATYPGIMLISAAVFLHEKIKQKDLVGLILIITGVIGISFI